MIRSMKILTVLVSIVFLVLMVACSSSLVSKTGVAQFASDSAGAPEASRGVPSPSMAPAPAPEPSRPSQGPSAPAAAAPAGLPGNPGGSGYGGADGDSAFKEESFGEVEGGTDAQAALVSQQRIIIRTVNMQLVVREIAGSVDDISLLAKNAGGWVVSSNRSAKHIGSVAVRVPADQLDAFVLSLRNLAVEVDSESSTSRDVTTEYVDYKSELTVLHATEETLLGFLDQARSVEDALAVQRELSKLQANIESIQGRIKFLEETAAFSLVSVGLRLAPVDILVIAGDNQTYSVGHSATFKAEFVPPVDMDIDEFFTEWDFGDGTPKIIGVGSSASLDDEGRRFTATVSHIYFDDRESPYIVEIKITGTGDGVAEGEASFIATVTRIPSIEVFSDQRIEVEEGDEVEFVGSFTRPEGLREIEYTWDFGDQTAPISVKPADGVTRATATHTYADHRLDVYRATLTVTAQSDVGEIKTASHISVFVTESKGLVISGWSASDTGKTAIRTLSVVAQVVGSVIIWVAIFSPVWLIAGAVFIFGRRRVRAKRKVRAESMPAEEQIETGSSENE